MGMGILLCLLSLSPLGAPGTALAVSPGPASEASAPPPLPAASRLIRIRVTGAVPGGPPRMRHGPEAITAGAGQWRFELDDIVSGRIVFAAGPSTPG